MASITDVNINAKAREKFIKKAATPKDRRSFGPINRLLLQAVER
jgi:hypothetical protein